MLRFKLQFVLIAAVVAWSDQRARADTLDEVEKKLIAAWKRIESLSGKLSMKTDMNRGGTAVKSEEAGTLDYVWRSDKQYFRTEIKTNKQTKYGEHEMTPQQDGELLKILAGIQGKLQQSGYHSTMYDDFAANHGWRCEEVEIDNKSSSKKVKDKKIERLWMNY